VPRATEEEAAPFNLAPLAIIDAVAVADAQSFLSAVSPDRVLDKAGKVTWEATARQKADGFIIDGVTYLKNDRVEGWFPSSQDRSTLREAGIFHTQRNDTPTMGKKISGIKGKPRYYAINGEALDRLSVK